MTNFIKNGQAQVGGKQIPFRAVVLQEKFRMQVPESFQEDSSLSYRYSCLSNKSKSPLGIAIRYAPESEKVTKERAISNFFGGEVPPKVSEGTCPVYFRESISKGETFSVYLIRFAVEVKSGVLLGCFNCSGEFMEHWKPAILAMLHTVEEL